MAGAPARPGTARPVDVVADPVEAAILLADAFRDGARLSVDAPDAPDHAHHVAVEFVHPVIAGLPALPAAVRIGEPRADDIVFALGAAEPEGARPPDLMIPPGRSDAEVMSLYHLLWELVHVALDDRARDVSAGDSTGFLYPFLDGGDASAGRGEGVVLRTALAAAAEAQRADSARACASAVALNADAIDAAARAIASSARDGGRVHAMGNGGSATDAARAVRLLTGIGVPCSSLAGDYAVVTALANDLGAERMFARQIDAFVRPGDVVCGWSTSGTSPNLIAGFERATALGARCIGSCGYGGGALVELDAIDVTLAIDEQSVHRIQEGQADVMDAVVAATAERLGRVRP